MSKLAVNFIGAIGSRAGSLDSFLGAGLAVSDCNNDKDAKLAASISGIGGFLSNFPSTLGRVGNFLGLASSLRNIEVAVKTRNISHIKLNDIYSLGAAVAGLTGASYLAATLSVGGLILTLSDLVGSGGSQGQCNNKNKTPPTPGDLVQPKDSPNPGPAGDVPLGCPLIIDMDKNGIKTISVNKNVLFDLDNNLFAENTGWVGEGDALLVWDRDNNGFIDSGNELFGNHTMLANGDKAANGFIALHSLDSNGDNIFDAKDDKWLTLQLWFDHNQNGISEDGELVKLSESGIKSIDLSYRNIDITDENENVHRQISRVTWENGEESDITDVWFKKNSSKSFYKEQIDVSEDIKEMPNIVAFGNLLNLHEAMVKSPHLVYVIQEYIDSSFEDRKQLLEHLIYEWTGVSHITSSSRGNFIDARKLHSLEILFGEEFRQRGINLNPNRAAAEILEKEFNKFASYVMAQLESKTIYRDLFSITSFNINSEGGLEFDWSKLNSKIEGLVRENNLLEAKHILSIYKNIGIYNNDYQVEINKNLSALSEHRKEIAYLINSFLVEGSLKDDILKGSNDDDILIGKLGNDTINAGAGNDVLVGGRGNDVMRGGLGADTYIFSKGHGQDLIYEDSNETHRARDIDIIRFTDVSSQEVKFRRLGNDLMLFG
ncbi:TPA: hypothetical protein ACT2D0_000001, partial [Pasteurella multocida]|uniref:calcium-binding protein n=2 Tax=Pasteurella multocida TaxID=747 RepID=UPI00397D8177